MNFTEEQKKLALNTQHQLMVIDQLVKLEVDGFQVKMTLGWETPQGTLMPVCTIHVPLPFASKLADTINLEIKNKKKVIIAQHKELQDSI